MALRPGLGVLKDYIIRHSPIVLIHRLTRPVARYLPTEANIIRTFLLGQKSRIDLQIKTDP